MRCVLRLPVSPPMAVILNSICSAAKAIGISVTSCGMPRRYVLMNCEGKDTGLAIIRIDEVPAWNIPMPTGGSSAVCNWRKSRSSRLFDDYRFDMAAREIYEFVWDEYCDWYLEFAKVQLNDGSAPYSAPPAARWLAYWRQHYGLPIPLFPLLPKNCGKTSRRLPASKARVSCCSPIRSRPRESQRRRNRPDRCAQGNDQRLPTLRGEMNLSPASRVPLLAQERANAR